MSSAMQDSRKITMKCPNCSIDITEAIEFFRSSPAVMCPGCGASINFDASAVEEAIKGAARAAH